MAVSPSRGGESSRSAEHRASGRGPDGRFLPGNTSALKHGGRSRQVREAQLAEQAEVWAGLSDKREAILTDLGGAEQVTQVQRDLVDRYLELDTVASYLGGSLLAQGPLTTKGRSRAALSAYVLLTDRLLRMAQVLGVDGSRTLRNRNRGFGGPVRPLVIDLVKNREELKAAKLEQESAGL